MNSSNFNVDMIDGPISVILFFVVVMAKVKICKILLLQ